MLLDRQREGAHYELWMMVSWQISTCHDKCAFSHPLWLLLSAEMTNIATVFVCVGGWSMTAEWQQLPVSGNLAGFFKYKAKLWIYFWFNNIYLHPSKSDSNSDVCMIARSASGLVRKVLKCLISSFHSFLCPKESKLILICDSDQAWQHVIF